jgi:hypothetical protein
VINVTDIRSDAIIVSTSEIKAISLPEMAASKVQQWVQWNAESDTDGEGEIWQWVQQCVTNDTDTDEVEEWVRNLQWTHNNEIYVDFLYWLWSKCVKLVLAELKYDKSTSIELPRIWWIGTGLASSLPFHAAGDHSDGSLENTLSHVISSYTPTIKSLAYARECASRSAQVSGDKSSVLMVTMPETPGEESLPSVEYEMSVVQEVVGDVYSIQTLVKPDVQEVLTKMENSEIVHFACHGCVDYTDPSESHLLLLNNSQSQPTIDELTVRRISEKRAWIAYLSACSTAEINAGHLADEVLHLVSGFQVAGFGHVIGSLWSADDATCVRMANLGGRPKR